MEFMKKRLCVATGFISVSYLNQQTVSLQRQHVISDVRRLRRVVARGRREVVCVRVVKAWWGRRGGAPFILTSILTVDILGRCLPWKYPTVSIQHQPVWKSHTVPWTEPR